LIRSAGTQVGGEGTGAAGVVRTRRGAPAAAPDTGPASGWIAWPRHDSQLPVHPGCLLETHFLKPRRISQQALARELGISRRRVNELIRGHRGITPDTALRLALFFNTEPWFWMAMQMAWDIHRAVQRFRTSQARAVSHGAG